MSYALMAPTKSAVVQPANLKNNFGLTQAQFDRYVLKLREGDESFLSYIAEKHFKVCISYLIYNCNISEDKAYDTCLDTMLSFRKKLLANKISYGNLSYLYTRMAKNTYIDSHKKKAKVEDAINFFTDGDDTYKENENKFFEVLDKSMEALDQENLSLLKDIYYSDKDIHKVAQENNISYATLRKRKQRLIKRLKNIFISNLEK